MPELPEVETTCAGIKPHCLNRVVTDVVIRQPQLRWPVPAEINQAIGQNITAIIRRAKYIIMALPAGNIILHLGMSGCLKVLPTSTPATKHDHIDIVFDDICLRLNDPRRFGAVLWCEDDASQHALLSQLGPEPLSQSFNADYLFHRAKGRKSAIKNFIMDSHVVVGVGNIYAQEALFMAGIHPGRAAGRVSMARYEALVTAIKKVLRLAIKAGGTTLRDFRNAEGKPGYFRISLNVYGRGGENCTVCEAPLKSLRLQQRSTVYCGQCQR